MRLLIAEDDQALSGFLRRGLCEVADEIEIAHDGEMALELFLSREPDLLILDLDLPIRSGVEVLEIVRQLSPLCPVLVLSGRAEADTRITCLDKGADDCMMKPFFLGELRARCRAMLRRQQLSHAVLLEQASTRSMLEESETEGPATLCMGALRMQRVRRVVDVAGVPLHLTNREFTLLEQLLLGGGSPVSRKVLREIIWKGKVMETNALDVHMATLRRKLNSLGSTETQARNAVPEVETVRGAGYRLILTPAAEELLYPRSHPAFRPVSIDTAFASA